MNTRAAVGLIAIKTDYLSRLGFTVPFFGIKRRYHFIHMYLNWQDVIMFFAHGLMFVRMLHHRLSIQ